MIKMLMAALPNKNLCHEEFLLRHTDKLSMVERGMLWTSLHIITRHFKGKRRRNKKKYYTHLLFVAYMALFSGCSIHSVVAAMLHDSIEHGYITPDEIIEAFGEVDGCIIAIEVSALSEDKSQTLAIYFQKIIDVSSDRWETFLIKIFDRIHNHLTSFGRDLDSEMKYLEETLGDFYAMCLACRRFVPLSKKDMVADYIAVLITIADARLKKLKKIKAKQLLAA